MAGEQILSIKVDRKLLRALEDYKAIKGYDSVQVAALEALRIAMFGTVGRPPVRLVLDE